MLKAETVVWKGRLSRVAGKELGTALLARLGAPPDACWLFCSPRDHLPQFLAGLVQALGTDRLIGCTTDGEIASDGLHGQSVVLAGVISDRIQFTLAMADNLHRGAEEAGQRLAEALGPEVRHVQLFSDGITGNGCGLLRGLRQVWRGRQVPVTGGCAGDQGRFVRTYQFLGEQVLTDAAVAIGFAGDFALGTGVRSGWCPIGLPKKVTRVRGNVLYELNHQPALEVYERFLGKHAPKLPAVGVEYPLGLISECQEEDCLLLRATMSVNRQEGSITFAGEIPAGATVRLTCGDINSVLAATKEAATRALTGLGDRPPGLAFFYSCMARKIILGRRTKEEYAILRQLLGPEVPLVGFYTYGEYCPWERDGENYFHNETAVVTLISA